MSGVDLSALVASPHWRWMPGMHAEMGAYGGLVVHVCQDGSPVIAWAEMDSDGSIEVEWHAVLPATPDFDDPATLGCILALVREAWGEPLAYIQPYNGRWAVWSGSTTVGGIHPWGRLLGVGDTEDEAAAAALLAAPPKSASYWRERCCVTSADVEEAGGRGRLRECLVARGLDYLGVAGRYRWVQPPRGITVCYDDSRPTSDIVREVASFYGCSPWSIIDEMSSSAPPKGGE